MSEMDFVYCTWWNIFKLNLRNGGSLGDVPQNLTLNYKNSIYFRLLIHYQEYK
jgi:hypothetical protein